MRRVVQVLIGGSLAISAMLAPIATGRSGAATTLLAPGDSVTLNVSGVADTSLTIPSGICGIQVDLLGGAGGGQSDSIRHGGLGGEVNAAIGVGPGAPLAVGDTLTISVGAGGDNGGWGGSPGGTPGNYGGWQFASPGGGATTVAVGGTLLAVAAGGGGASLNTPDESGGGGGGGGIIGTSSDNGGQGLSATSAYPGSQIHLIPATGGSATGPGIGGTYDSMALINLPIAVGPGNDGSSTILGGGGKGADSLPAPSYPLGGGGGGGGYYGGGGGGIRGVLSGIYANYAGGGGGGSSYLMPQGFALPGTATPSAGDGSATVTALGCQSVAINPVVSNRLFVGDVFTAPALSDQSIPVVTTVAPESAANCSVDGQSVTMIASGVCTISSTALAGSGFMPVRASYSLDVLASGQGLSLSGTSFGSLPVGHTRQIVAATTNSDPDAVIVASSADATVCAVSPALVVSALTVGTCSITVSVAATLRHLATSTTFQLAIAPSDTRGVSVDGSNLAPLLPGTSRQIVAAVVPADLSVQLVGVVQDQGICTVNQALVVTGVSAGTCILTISAPASGAYLAVATTLNITIGSGLQTPDVNVSGTSFAGLEVSQTRDLVVTSSNTEDPSVIASPLWPSGSYCSLANLTVTAIAPGTCTIVIQTPATQSWSASTMIIAIPIIPGPAPISTCDPLTTCLLGIGAGSVNLGNAVVYLPGDDSARPLVSSPSPGKISGVSVTPSVCKVTKGRLKTIALGVCTINFTQAVANGYSRAGTAQGTFFVAAKVTWVSVPPSMRRNHRYSISFRLTGCATPTPVGDSCSTALPTATLSKASTAGVVLILSISTDGQSASYANGLFTSTFTVPRYAPVGRYSDFLPVGMNIAPGIAAPLLAPNLNYRIKA